MNPTTRAFYPNGLSSIADRPRATWTPEAFRARALELLATQPLVWSGLRRLGYEVNDDGRLVWLALAVPSASRPGVSYRARYEVVSDSAVCSCVERRRRQPCAHAGVALAYGREVAGRRGNA